MMKLAFVNIHIIHSLTIFANSSFIDVWLNPKYPSALSLLQGLLSILNEQTFVCLAYYRLRFVHTPDLFNTSLLYCWYLIKIFNNFNISMLLRIFFHEDKISNFVSSWFSPSYTKNDFAVCSRSSFSLAKNNFPVCSRFLTTPQKMRNMGTSQMSK